MDKESDGRFVWEVDPEKGVLCMVGIDYNKLSEQILKVSWCKT